MNRETLEQEILEFKIKIKEGRSQLKRGLINQNQFDKGLKETNNKIYKLKKQIKELKPIKIKFNPVTELPKSFNDTKVVLNPMIKSSICNISQFKSNEYTRENLTTNLPIMSTSQYTIIMHTGYQLCQFHADVYSSIVSIISNREGATNINTISFKELADKLEIRNDEVFRSKVILCIDHLTINYYEIHYNGKGKLFKGHLVNSVLFEGKSADRVIPKDCKEFTISVGKDLRDACNDINKLYNEMSDYELINKDDCLLLDNFNNLEKRLFQLFDKSEFYIKYSLRTLYSITGSRDVLRKFRYELKEAIDEVNKVVNGYKLELNEEDLVVKLSL